MIKKTILQYCILSALMRLGIGSIVSTYVTFLTTKGLDLFQVNIVNLIFFVSLLIFEIPTGAFADVFGRKLSVILACLFLSGGTFFYGLSNSMWQFFISEILSALGTTFASGAFQAWLKDTLDHHGYSGKLAPILSRANFWGNGIGILGALGGSWLADRDIRYPWFLGSLTFILTAGICQIWLTEEYFVHQTFSWKLGFKVMKETVATSIEYGINNKVVRFILLVGLIQVFAVQAPNMQWQPYFMQFFQQKKNLGYVWMGIALCLMLGSYLAPKLHVRVNNEKKCLVLCQISAGLGMATITLLPYPWNILMFFLHEIPRGMYMPLKDMYLQDNIPARERATVSSFEAISPHFGGIIGLLGSGFLAEKCGIPVTWFTSGLLLVVGTLIVSKNGRNGKG